MLTNPNRDLERFLKQVLKDDMKYILYRLSEVSKVDGKNSIEYFIHEKTYDETKLLLKEKGIIVNKNPSPTFKDGHIDATITLA
ncbi:hypothetical protein AB7W88_10925 [Providencia vermicola]|uniref:hypothetical protein n=1 Tax=Providencia vermicola TaxID=333965 RepID=UPI0034E60908